MNENWKDIEGYEGAIQVSDHGNVRSLDRIIVGKRFNTRRKGKMYTPAISSSKYLTVTLRHNGEMKTPTVHRLVATAFVEGFRDYLFVNHIDGNKLNNKAENLEWVTRKENTSHACRLGLYPKEGERNDAKCVGKYNVEGVLIEQFESLTQAARITGVAVPHISAVANNKRLKSAGGYIWKFI